MNRLIIMLVVLFSFQTIGCKDKYRNTASIRISKTINTEWTFNYFPEQDADQLGVEKAAFDDSKWSAVALPHTWMTYETTGELHPYIKNVSPKDNPYWWDGWGWYRKRLVLDKSFSERKIFLEFDGVQKYSKLWVNGKFIGDHKGGYTSFYFDITDAVNLGQENLIVLAVNNTMNDKFSIPPMSAGNFDVYGGIHRDVRLLITDKLYVPYQGSYKHEGGTFVTTPVVNDKEGIVSVSTFVKNEYPEAQNTTLKTIISDKEDRIIDEIETAQTINPGELFEFKQTSNPVKKPHLWSPESPYVYKVKTEVYKNDQLVDTYLSPLGFRWFHWDYKTDKLYLNGKMVRIHGQNRHEEYVWLGGAFPKWIAMRDMKDIRYGLEHNFMRTAHYPQDPSIYNFTDRHGIFIDEELPNIKKQDFNEEVKEQNCREMIRRDRNHPSIFFWSMGNETTDAANSLWAHQEDTTRIITSRHVYNNSMGDYAPHSEKNMSIEGFLRCTIKGWYDKDDRNLEPEDSQHAGTEVNDVNRALEKNVQSHYGSVWLYADHGADREYVNSPLLHINPKGWVDSWRNPKYKYYLWQANFATKPMVFIQYHFWRSKYLGQKKDFMVHSNCDDVELLVNGKSYGKQKLNAENQYTVVFNNVTVEKGTLEAIGTKSDGTSVHYSVTMAGEAQKLVLKPTATTAEARLNSIVELKADIVDANGIHVIGANPKLKWNVSGPAKLVGPDVYLSDRDRTEKMEGTMYIDVPVTNLIRSTGKPGKVVVSISSTGLEPAQVEIDFTEYSDTEMIDGISEPGLNPDGREPVKHNVNQVSHLAAPQEMKHFVGELNFPLENISKQLIQFISEQNKNVSHDAPEFKFLVSVFEEMMKANNGRLVADDYNFVVDQYNISREITRFINERDLPSDFQKQLTDYYARAIVLNGRDKNFVYQKKMIADIPEGGKAVVLNGNGKLWKNSMHTNESNLPILLKQIYPNLATWPDDKLQDVLELLVNINPYIKSTRTRDRETKIYTYYYSIEPGKVILFPDFEKLTKSKFPENVF